MDGARAYLNGRTANMLKQALILAEGKKAQIRELVGRHAEPDAKDRRKVPDVLPNGAQGLPLES